MITVNTCSNKINKNIFSSFFKSHLYCFTADMDKKKMRIKIDDAQCFNVLMQSGNKNIRVDAIIALLVINSLKLIMI